MKINPKIAKSPEDLKSLEFKKMKVFIKKELKRLEKYTSSTEPTQFIILGEFDYPDKPAMALPLFGKWKGRFKEYAKKEVVKDKLGAIGTAFYGGIDESGQKKVHMNLAKGLGKNKTGKLERTLKKLIPQATYNVIFSEIDEAALNSLEQKLDAAPEVEEVFEDGGEDTVLLDKNQDFNKILTYNFQKIMEAFKPVKEEVVPRLKSLNNQDGDADLVIDLDDLAEEWLQIYESAGPMTRMPYMVHQDKVLSLRKNLSTVLNILNEKDNSKSQNFGFIDNLMAPGEKPDPRFDIGLSKENLQGIFMKQGQGNNCDASARMIVYNYLEKKGVVKIDRSGLNKANGNSSSLMLYAAATRSNSKGPFLNDFVDAGGYEINYIYDGKNTGTIPITEEKNGQFFKSAAYEKAIAYIDSNLKNGIPVIAGVGIPNYSSGNADSSDHFIVIVGKSDKGYFYMDPGSQFGSDLNANLLEAVPGKDYMFKDPNLAWTAKYGDKSGNVVLTSVAVYPKDKEQVNKIPDITVFEITGKVTKGVGSVSDIKVVQTLLQKAGYNIGAAGVDGSFGNGTLNAIIQFQKDHNINPADGIVAPGSATWLALKEKSGINPAAALKPEDIKISYEGSIQKMAADKEHKLRELLAAAGEAQAVIINTFRSAEEQAKVMYANIKALGAKANRKQYKNPAAASQVVDAYETAVTNGENNEAKLIGVILETINKVGAAQLSGHCNSSNPAVDILPSSIKNKGKFMSVLNSSAQFSKLVAPPKDSSFHLEFK